MLKANWYLDIYEEAVLTLKSGKIMEKAQLILLHYFTTFMFFHVLSWQLQRDIYQCEHMKQVISHDKFLWFWIIIQSLFSQGQMYSRAVDPSANFQPFCWPSWPVPCFMWVWFWNSQILKGNSAFFWMKNHQKLTPTYHILWFSRFS